MGHIGRRGRLTDALRRVVGALRRGRTTSARTLPPAGRQAADVPTARLPAYGLCPYETFSAVSSRTNDVCSEESSVPVNFSVTVCPT